MAGSWIFYTTFPKIPLINPEFKNIAQFAPPLGFLIGTIQSYIFLFLTTNSWSIYASALICLASGYLITGGLHIDGLMDTFDGIFAGKKKRLKAMKDSKIGSFGVQALVFITLIQIACILKIQNLIIFILLFIAYQFVSITSQAILIKFLILILIGIFLSYSIPNILGNKIGCFNGDACGASVVLVETGMLFIHAILL